MFKPGTPVRIKENATGQAKMYIGIVAIIQDFLTRGYLLNVPDVRGTVYVTDDEIEKVNLNKPGKQKKKVPHKHAAIIKAWADGEQIQYLNATRGGGQWQDIKTPSWCLDVEYRVKPVARPDVVRYYYVAPTTGNLSIIGHTNLKCVFDGETLKLKYTETI